MSDAFGLAHFLSQQGRGLSKIKRPAKGFHVQYESEWFKLKERNMSKVAGGEFKFYLGDVVQFNTVYNWCDGATLNVNYNVVEDVTAAKWGTGEDVNGFTKEISLRCVNEYWQDFMLVERSEPVETVGPVTVNVVINSDDPVDPKHSELADKIVKHIRDQYRPGGTLFYGDSKPYPHAHTGMIHTGKPRPAMIPPNPLLNVTDEQRVYLKEALKNRTPEAVAVPIAEGVAKVGAAVIGASVGPIKSDGGSSSYYDLPIPDQLMNKIFDRWDNGQAYIKTEEMIRYFFKNDFDFGTALKSLVRAHGTLNGGGKEGNDIVYETNKVQYYAKKIGEIHGKKDQ